MAPAVSAEAAEVGGGGGRLFYTVIPKQPTTHGVGDHPMAEVHFVISVR